MTADFTGERFVGMDDDAAGDGAAGTTQPVDTYLENAVANNTTYLWKGGWACSWTPRQVTDAEAKLVSSWRWATLWEADIPLDATIATLTFEWLAAVENRLGGGTGAPAVDVRVRVKVGEDEIASYSKTIPDTGGDYEPKSLGVNLYGQDVRQGVGYVRLQLQIKQNTDGDGTTGRRGFDDLPLESSVEVKEWGDGDIFKSTTDLSFDQDSCVKLTRLDTVGFTDDSFGVFDLLDAYGATDQFAIHRPSDITRPALGVINGARIARLDIMRVRGLQVSATYDEGPSNQYDEKPQPSMLPKTAVRGGQVARHAQRANAEYARQRPCILGVHGEELAAWNRVTWWRHIYASDASTFTAIQSAPFEFGVSQGRFVARLRLYAVTQWILNSSTNPGDLIGSYLAGDWQIRLTVEQMQGGTSWSQAATIAGPETIDADAAGAGQVQHMLYSTRGSVPWLLQAWAAKNYGAAQFNETYREGLQYAGDELATTQNVYSTTMDIDDAKAKPLDPARLLVEVKGPQSAADYDYTEVEEIAPELLNKDPPSQTSLLSVVGLQLFEQGF